MKIIKRNGSEAVFDISKIIAAVTKANNVVASNQRLTKEQITAIADDVAQECQSRNHAMNEHINKGEIEAARAIQYDADRIIYKMCEAHGNLYAVQKEILRRMYGLELGGVREPMPGLIPEDEPIVAEAQAMIEAAIAKL